MLLNLNDLLVTQSRGIRLVVHFEVLDFLESVLGLPTHGLLILLGQRQVCLILDSRRDLFDLLIRKHVNWVARSVFGMGVRTCRRKLRFFACIGIDDELSRNLARVD